MSPDDWAAFHVEVTRAKEDIRMKACLVECAACWFFMCVCVFCFHPIIEDGMGKSKLAGCCNRINKKAFQGREIVAFSGGSVLCVNTGSLKSLPMLAATAQGVATHSPMQQHQGQPQYVQGGQPVYVQQGQPQYVQQGYPPQYIQGQPQYVQQGHPPQYVHPGVQGQPPIVSAVVVSTPAGNQPPPQKYVEEDPPTELPPPSSPPLTPQAPVPPAVTSRQGQYVISDASVLGTTVAIKTPEGAVVQVAVPADCPMGTTITYSY
eukprot:CAMPEP_0114455126 /NCGR_PEP_ID=MMETSP0104-20121206/2937_1 /TAXON_ID=37642 ORGANISM="Paraphysomonas imperforata, Strain PA2" /NCGR_SAMPLE_ID=MMETSP0104 /ASSEMBLY_ACC=CAM_ASM_000202 /LENGTH=262 /DNA_ID=CAMNT_0001627533 /DNA_START=27 /DNA_END=815 /DNA_ORIENTATION=+